MKFIDTQDAHPTVAGQYRILIVDADSGDTREANAVFRMQSGNFLPIADTLRGSEYVKAWKQIEVNEGKFIEGPDRYYNSEGK